MRIGFVGAGNMGGAIVRGYAQSRAMMSDKPDALFVYDSDAEKAAALAKPGWPINAAGSLAQLVGLCDAIVLCVKPNAIDEVLDLLAALGAGAGKVGGFGAGAEAQEAQAQTQESDAPPFAPDANGKLIISIAAGISIPHILEKLGARTRVVRVMPNTPAMVGEGMSALSAPPGLPEGDSAAAEKLFGAVGRAVWVPEELMDIVTGISGSSPAYAYLYMEGLIQSGVGGGLSKEAATILAAQSTLGAAKMVLENLGETEPAQLCANVCSPGGTTLEAVKALEAAGFTGTVKKAALASAAKSKLMTR
ncbi:MAG: pyrroline-5-carboxylate reductase [Clostridiales Family XIII bacterium]|jgi:pyrroline-5-carboxylate reductase|nr:pyrroline-5-carboxylate reductase [Clostridiales Family XIII bacterium]